MPLSASTLTALMQSSINFTGEYAPTLFSAISNAVVDHVVSNAIVTTVDTGTGPASGTPVGTGTISGLSGATLKGLFILNSNFTGEAVNEFWEGVSSSIANHIISNALVLTTHTPTVAIGTGIGTVSGLVATTLAQQIINNTGFTGEALPELADTIAISVVDHIATSAVASVVITGSPSGPQSPAAGSGTGGIT